MKHIKTLGISLLFVLCATQLSGCTPFEIDRPSAVYGQSLPAPKSATDASAQRSDLTGAVKDTSGAPIKGATVFIYTAKPRTGTSPFCPSCYADCIKRGVTSASGVFRIPSLAQSLIFRVLIIKDGFEPTFVRNVDPSRGKISVALKKSVVTPELKARSISGRVLDPLNQPVVGATIYPFAVKFASGESFGAIKGLDRVTITNERGEFHFISPDADSPVRVRISARGLASSNIAGLSAATPNLIRLPWGVTVKGTVRSVSGKAVSGAVVQIVPTDLNSETFTGWIDVATDSTGKFTLYNVPANREYNICVKMDSLTKSNLGTTTQTIKTGRDDTVMREINFTLRPAASIAGQVVLTDGKKIPPGTRIMLSRAGTWDMQQVILSPAGHFAFKNMPQEQDMSLTVRVIGYHWADGSDQYKRFSTRIPSNLSKNVVLLSLAPDKK